MEDGSYAGPTPSTCPEYLQYLAAVQSLGDSGLNHVENFTPAEIAMLSWKENSDITSHPDQSNVGGIPQTISEMCSTDKRPKRHPSEAGGDVRKERARNNVGIPWDGFEWRKYGQKQLFTLNIWRHYYRCSLHKTRGTECPAKKWINFDPQDPRVINVVLQCAHNHPPTQSAPSPGASDGENEKSGAIQHRSESISPSSAAASLIHASQEGGHLSEMSIPAAFRQLWGGGEAAGGFLDNLPSLKRRRTGAGISEPVAAPANPSAGHPLPATSAARCGEILRGIESEQQRDFERLVFGEGEAGVGGGEEELDPPLLGWPFLEGDGAELELPSCLEEAAAHQNDRNNSVRLVTSYLQQTGALTRKSSSPSPPPFHTSFDSLMFDIAAELHRRNSSDIETDTPIPLHPAPPAEDGGCPTQSAGMCRHREKEYGMAEILHIDASNHEIRLLPTPNSAPSTRDLPPGSSTLAPRIFSPIPLKYDLWKEGRVAPCLSPQPNPSPPRDSRKPLVVSATRIDFIDEIEM